MRRGLVGRGTPEHPAPVVVPITILTLLSGSGLPAEANVSHVSADYSMCSRLSVLGSNTRVW